MAREYFAEASVAHFTQAREWGFYNSGMDKRALYYLYENIRAKEIDKQREEDDQKAPDPAEGIMPIFPAEKHSSAFTQE